MFRVLMHWLECIEPPRTSLNYIITERARCVEFFYMISEWFDCTEPSLTTSLEGKQGVQGAYVLVRVHRTSSNLLELHHYRESKVCRVLLHL